MPNPIPTALSPQWSQRACHAGSGPISALMQIALARPELISLAAGFVDQETLPVAETTAALTSLLNDIPRARTALQYGTNAGYLPLRMAVLERFLAAEGSPSSPAPTVEQVVLTAGSNQLLHLVGEVLLDPGDIVLCAAPSYFVYLGMLAGLQARSVGVAIDRDGMRPDALDEQLRDLSKAGQLQRVKAIYITSYYENPSTVTLPLERRAAIVEIAKRWSHRNKIYVIDDTAYRDLRYTGHDLPSLRSFDAEGDTVIVAETFSKSFSPGIRVGWGILPPLLVEPVCAQKANIDFGSPNFNQHLMSTVLERGLFAPHVERLRQNYRVKLAAMLSALDEHLGAAALVRWNVPSGGLYVWLELPPGMSAGPESALMAHALHEGVLYVPGEYCYPVEGQPRRSDRIRLSFGVQTSENIRRGIEALARAIRRTL
ncbi:MAG TPA: PLP-dependent aminotransferase family protein [Pirellulales bacterium]|nr:PLP-dependent aminotransferase family protein [Pirellulales bacterium]